MVILMKVKTGENLLIRCIRACFKKMEIVFYNDPSDNRLINLELSLSPNLMHEDK